MASQLRSDTHAIERSMMELRRTIREIIQEWRQSPTDSRDDENRALLAEHTEAIILELTKHANALMEFGSLEKEKRLIEEKQRELQRRETSVKQQEFEQQRSKRFILKNANQKVNTAHLPRSWTDAKDTLADIHLLNAEVQGIVPGEEKVRAAGEHAQEFVWLGRFVSHRELARIEENEPCDPYVLSRTGKLRENNPFVLGMRFILFIVQSEALYNPRSIWYNTHIDRDHEYYIRRHPRGVNPRAGTFFGGVAFALKRVPCDGPAPTLQELWGWDDTHPAT